MSNSSFIQVYRDLLSDPSFVNLPPSYRCVFITLIVQACFEKCTQDDHGVKIDLLPGQFMCTIRHLADISNVGKNDAERALKKFVELKKVRLEVRHKKTIVTILWGLKLNSCETRKETRSRQDRDTKEEGLPSSFEKEGKQEVEKKEEPIKKKTTTTTTNKAKSSSSFSRQISEEVKEAAKKAFDYTRTRLSKDPDEKWNIDLAVFEKNFHIYGIFYCTDQLNYLIERMDKYWKNKSKQGNKLKQIDDPKVYFEKACSEDYAKSLHRKEK